MAGSPAAACGKKRVEAAFRDWFNGIAALPGDLNYEWRRLQWCLTMSWTFDEFERQDVGDLERAEIMLDKARRFHAPLKLVDNA